MNGDLLRRRLRSAGFRGVDAAAEEFTKHPEIANLLPTFHLVADPDLALSLLAELERTCVQWVASVASDQPHLLLALLGGSSELGHYLLRNQHVFARGYFLRDEDLTDMRSAMLTSVGAHADDSAPVATGDVTALKSRLRVRYRQLITLIAARDLALSDPSAGIDHVTQRLSTLADAALEAALAVARGQVAGSETVPLGILALGKLGGQELNYQSDVDVTFLVGSGSDAEGMRVAERVVALLIDICSSPGSEPALWPVDTVLRPEGRQGALLHTVDGALNYYLKHAQPWEFQALIKARPSAGDQDVLNDFMKQIQVELWSAAARQGFIQELRSLRELRESRVPRDLRTRDLKQGQGGLRSVEFTTQLLQLSHGLSDPSVRSPNTLRAVSQLAQGGYLSRPLAATVSSNYRHMRAMEHRVQLPQLRATHLLPTGTDQLRVLARAMYPGQDRPVRRLESELERIHLELKQFQEDVYYRPLIDLAAAGGVSYRGNGQHALTTRLISAGYTDPQAALDGLATLSRGPGRSAQIQRQLAPALLGWFSLGADPDLGVRSYISLSDQIGGASWYLALLRDSKVAAKKLCVVLASSQWAEGALSVTPRSITWLDSPDRLRPVERSVLQDKMTATLQRHDAPEAAARAVKSLLGLELTRTALADLSEQQVSALHPQLTVLGELAVQAALQLARREIEDTGQVFPKIAALALGHFGGGENGYVSDLDLWFVHADGEDPARASAAVRRTVELLNQFRQEAMWAVDMGLRPEGATGALVRSETGVVHYYERWAAAWERQAALRLRAVAGDANVGVNTVANIHKIIIDRGVTEADLREIRMLKARGEKERLPRGADPLRNVKLGPGGMTDIEWTIEITRMRALRAVVLPLGTTIQELQLLEESGAIKREDALALREAWILAAKIRNANWLAVAPARLEHANEIFDGWADLRKVSALLGDRSAAPESVVERWREKARGSRRAMDRYFWA